MRQHQARSTSKEFHIGCFGILFFYGVIWFGSSYFVRIYDLYPEDWGDEEVISGFTEFFRNCVWTQVIVALVVWGSLIFAYLKGILCLVNKGLDELAAEQLHTLRNSPMFSDAWRQDRQLSTQFDLLPLKQLALSFITISAMSVGLGAFSLGLTGPPNENLPKWGLNLLFAFSFLFINVVALYSFSVGMIANRMTDHLRCENLVAKGINKEKPAGLLVFLGKTIALVLFIPISLIAFSIRFFSGIAARFRDMSSPYEKARHCVEKTSQLSPYDTFISYSSFDVLRARHITEQLIADGRVPWFAEYCIGANNWTNDEDELERILNEGIKHSKTGLIFSSSHYERSGWCLQELIALDDPLAVLECSPLNSETSQVAKELKGVPARCKQPLTTLEKSLAHVCMIFDWKPVTVPNVHSEYRAPDFNVTSGWRVTLNGWEHVGDMETPRGSLGPRYQRYYGKYVTTLNIMAGPVANDQIPYNNDVADDRKYRESIMEFVQKYSEKTGVEVAGAHLIHVAKRGHFSATYRHGPAWIRKYSLNFPLDCDRGKFKKGQTWEFVLTFGFHGPFREFCRYAWCFDLAVQTFEWHPERATFDFV